MIGYVLAFLAVAGFGYFVYTKIKESREAKNGGRGTPPERPNGEEVK